MTGRIATRATIAGGALAIALVLLAVAAGWRALGRNVGRNAERPGDASRRPRHPSGDLGERNAGMLVFVDGRRQPEYVPWADVQRVDFDRPPAMYPPLRGRSG